MNVIRTTSDNFRILENFWESQLKSKIWLIKTIKNHLSTDVSGNIYIFGGWYGILAQLIADTYPNVNVYSIDIDPTCVVMGRLLSDNDSRIEFLTGDIKDFRAYENPVAIINTSTEHVTQDVFNQWISNIPKEILVILQGNDFFSCNEHIRCSANINEFEKMNSLDDVKFKGTLHCNQFTRFMILGTLNAKT